MITLTDLWTTDPVWQVPESWRQGRGAWGGLVAGQVVTAASHNLPEPSLEPRSVWIGMLGPVPAGDIACEVVELRRGRATLSREVTLRDSGGELLTRAVVVFGVPRAPTDVSEPATLAPDPAPQPAERFPIGPPAAPEFSAHLDFRPAVGIPYTGAQDLVTAGWIGPGEGSTDELTPAVVAALVDAWWTVTIVGIDGAALTGPPPPVATLDFALTFPQAPLPGPAPWDTGLWHVGRVIGGDDGYLTEERRLWSPDGRLLAVNTQLVAVGRAG